MPADFAAIDQHDLRGIEPQPQRRDQGMPIKHRREHRGPGVEVEMAHYRLEAESCCQHAVHDDQHLELERIAPPDCGSLGDDGCHEIYPTGSREGSAACRRRRLIRTM
jgi:hypothetical protein